MGPEIKEKTRRNHYFELTLEKDGRRVWSSMERAKHPS